MRSGIHTPTRHRHYYRQPYKRSSDRRGRATENAKMVDHSMILKQTITTDRAAVHMLSASYLSRVHLPLAN